jgi:DNA-binding transcriptional MerR regulator
MNARPEYSSPKESNSPDRQNRSSSAAEDRRVLSRFDVQILVEAPREWRYYSEDHFPTIVHSSSLADMTVTARSANLIDTLIKDGVISCLAELSNLTIGEVMSRPNFGVKSLADLLKTIEPVICETELPRDTAERLSPSLTRAASRLVNSRFSQAIRCDDPRMRDLLGELLCSANNTSSEEPLDLTATLDASAHRVVTRSRDPADPPAIEELIRRIRFTIAQLTRMKLEDELRTVTIRYVSRGRVDMVLKLLGWDGGCPLTLESTGRPFGISRQRVHQLQQAFKARSRHSAAFLPVLARTIEFIAKHAPVPADRLERLLLVRRLTKTGFPVETIGEAALWWQFPVQISRDGQGAVRVSFEPHGTKPACNRSLKFLRSIGYGYVGHSVTKSAPSNTGGQMQDMESMLEEQIVEQEKLIREHQDKLARLKRALEGYRGGSPTGFKCDPQEIYAVLRAADAAARHLDIVQRTLTMQELVSALIEGGCKFEGKPRTRWSPNLSIAIGAQMEGAKAAPHPRFYRDESGRVGLTKWKSSEPNLG